MLWCTACCRTAFPLGRRRGRISVCGRDGWAKLVGLGRWMWTIALTALPLPHQPTHILIFTTTCCIHVCIHRHRRPGRLRPASLPRSGRRPCHPKGVRSATYPWVHDFGGGGPEVLLCAAGTRVSRVCVCLFFWVEGDVGVGGCVCFEEGVLWNGCV